MNHSESYSNKDDVASATWPDPWATGDNPYYPYLSVPQSTLPDLISAPGYHPTAGSYVPDYNAADDAAFSLPLTTGMGAFTNPAVPQDVLDPWSMPAPSLLDANSAVSQPQLVSDPYLTGVAPLAAYSVAATPDSGMSPTSTTPTSQDTLAWLSEFLISPCTPASSPGHGGEAGWVAPSHGANVSEFTTSPAGWDTSGISWPIPAVPSDVTSNVTKTFAPAAALGKRRREAEQLLGGGPAGTHSHEMPPPKRVKGGGTAKGIPKAARSAARTRHKPAARIPKQENLNGKPKEAGRGAERLATLSSQGIYHRSLPGPSFQQGWAVDVADGKPTWVEGSVDEEAVHRIDSTVQQQQEEATEPFKIPRIFKPAYRRLLPASEADLARGAVQAIKCRLCPNTKLKDFEEFKRHCRTTETHSLGIQFCDRCGDFFARCDSLKRHLEKPPAKCRKVTPAKAAEKRRVTEEAHEDFIRRLEHILRAGGDIGRPFSQIIKERYPESSKKRTGGSKLRSQFEGR